MILGFLREVFSEDGQGSASRVQMAFHALAGVTFVFLHMHHEHKLPDAATMSGVTAFVTAPYAINKFHAAIASAAEAFRPKTS